MENDRYIHILESTGEYSTSRADESLLSYGYAHARELVRQGAKPVAMTIDGHIVLDLAGETWVVDAPRSGGRVEKLSLPWREVVEQVERNQPVSEVIGWDDDC